MTVFLDKTERVFDRIMTFFIGVVAVSIAGYVFLIPLNLVLIKMQLGGIWWLYEGVEYALYVGVFLGAPWVLKQGDHVRVDILASALPANAGRILDKVTNLLGAIICLVLIFYGSRATIIEFVDGTLPDKDLRIANWIMLSVFTVSFFMMAVEFLFRLRRSQPSNTKGGSL